jgi:hypothetical protein
VRIQPLLLLLAGLAACTDPTTPGAGGSTSAADTSSSTGGDSPTGDGPTSGTTGPDATDTSAGPTGDPTTAPTTGDPTTDGAWTPAQCYDGWDDLLDLYPDAGALGDCPAGPGFTVLRSLLVVDGLTIDNDGTPMTPCVEARCDADYAYIASNDLPHYDFVPITPNALTEAPGIVRVPLAPAAPGDAVAADGPEVQDGCVDAYDQYVANSGQATAREPSGLCVMADADVPYLRETLASGETSTTHKINCLGTIAVLINGVVVCGPNEAGNPDPYGNPFFYMPDLAGEPYVEGMSPALDLCGGHTGGSMHYHGANAACFVQAPDGTPANSYAAASQAWDLEQMLQGPCSEPSPILGWSPDGYPIKGPCVCADADCTTVKRARSSWVYSGLGSWGDPQDGDLATENQPCTSDDDCGGQTGNFRCAPVLVGDAGDAGTVVEKRCALLDYSWCTHRHVDRSTHGGAADFLYLDRCNGHEGPDGYAYHATASFPYVQACYHGVPAEISVGGMGMDDGPPMDGGMDPPMCMQGQMMMCCGDDNCDGPETADNYPEDCA